MCFERRKHNGAYTHSAAWNTHKCNDVSGNRSFFQIHTGPKMEGEGDCLFHADGGALRIDVADFLEAKALKQDGFDETWLLGEATTQSLPTPSWRRCGWSSTPITPVLPDQHCSASPLDCHEVLVVYMVTTTMLWCLRWMLPTARAWSQPGKTGHGINICPLAPLL